MAKIIPLAVKCSYTREVFTYSWLCHVGVAWEGGRNQVGSNARKGAEVVQKQGGCQWDTWQRRGLPGTAALLYTGSFPAETKLLGPFIRVPAAVRGFWVPAERSHAAWLNCSKTAAKSQFVCQPGAWRSQFCKEISVFFLICSSFFLAVVPALPVNCKPLREVWRRHCQGIWSNC